MTTLISACADCGTPVVRSGSRVLNAHHNSGGINHHLTCTSKKEAAMSQTLSQPTLDEPTSDMDKVERDRWGRPLIKQLDGSKAKAYQRVTTFIKAMDDTTGLSLWQQRMVARGLAARPDLLLSIQAHGDDDKELNRLCKEAMEAAASSAAATRGTALHRITERLDRGEPFDVPATVKADVDAYRAATAGIEWLHIERMVVHDDYQLAGTPDRIGVVDGIPTVCDLKTGSLWASSCAMQMAVYANSVLYDVQTGERSPLKVDSTRALVIHLPAGSGTCELVWVDLEAGWEAVECARKVHSWRKRKDLASPYQAANDVDVLGSLINAATSPDELTSLWQQHQGAWTPAHTDLAKQRKAQLLATVAA